MCVTIVTNQLYETAPHNHESGLSPQFFIKNIKFIILFDIFWNFSATKNDEVIKSSLEGQPYESNVITTDLFFQQQQKRHNSLCSVLYWHQDLKLQNNIAVHVIQHLSTR